MAVRCTQPPRVACGHHFDVHLLVAKRVATRSDMATPGPQAPDTSLEKRTGAAAFCSTGNQATQPSGHHTTRQHSIVHLRVELIDQSTRRLIKTWKFAPKAEITLGRAPESDVEVNNPYVSRHHASLSLRDDTWYLVSYGRNGVLVSGKLVQEFQATDGLEFRLGAHGPEFRLLISQSEVPDVDETATTTETIQVDERMLPEFLAALTEEELKLEIDQDRLAREVNEIAETDYFQRLQSLSRQLRQQRRGTSSE